MPNSAVTPTTELDALLTTRHEGHGMPRAFYHDAALYDAEIRRSGRRLAVRRIRDRDPAARRFPDAGSRRFVGTGDPRRPGSVRAFHNVCRHRGTLLCRKEPGTCAPSCARITAGRIRGRANSSHAPACTMASTRRSSGSSPFTSRSSGGLIYVSLAASPPAFDGLRERFGPRPSRRDSIGRESPRSSTTKSRRTGSSCGRTTASASTAGVPSAVRQGELRRL